MTVTVGLGTGNKDRQIQNIVSIMGVQDKLMGAGFGVTPDNIYNSAARLVELSGFKSAEEFFTDPKLSPPQPQGPSIEEQVAQAQIQLMAQQIENSRIEAETNRQEAIWKHEEKLQELRDKDLRDRTELELKYSQNVPGALT